MRDHHERWVMLAAIVAAASCSSDESDQGTRRPGNGGVQLGVPQAGAGGASGSAGSGPSFGNSDAPPPTDPGFVPTETFEPCVNLQCMQQQCFPADVTTTISGKVFDPAGRNPLYNVAVYVPNEPLAALTRGASCDDCDSLYTGHPIAATLTDSSGSFVLENAPVGSDIPLVVQIGKWRRQLTIPSVAACTDNPQPDGMLRLPRNQAEGDIPEIAIATGSADTLECLLRRVGVDASEYVPGAGGSGRIHIFAGSARVDDGGGGGGEDVVPNTAPPSPMASAALWNSLDSMLPYDIVLLSCEGQETLSMNQQVLHDYANAGGRVFASHFHYSWFNTGPFGAENLATWTTGSNDLGNISASIVTALPDGQPFPKGQALLEWLGTVGALQGGMLQIEEARHNADPAPGMSPVQSWITAASGEAPGAIQYFSFNTPISAALTPDAMYCGRVVYSDLHVGAASRDDQELPVPTGCTDRELSPQEAALEFMLFDLSSCLTPDDTPPRPPMVI
jgi:hypothetical protein